MSNNNLGEIIILITCPDQQGIVAKITSWLYEQQVNIISLEEHVENIPGIFFMRVVTQCNVIQISNEEFELKMKEFGINLNGKISVHYSKIKYNCAIFVTKEELPLYDLLIKNQKGDFNCHIKMIISNHGNLEKVAEQFKIPYYHFPVSSNNKLELEPQIIQLMYENNIDLIVLARYMQILSPKFIQQFEHKIINIHG